MNKEIIYSDLVDQTSSLLHADNYSDIRELLQENGFSLDQIALYSIDGAAFEAYIWIALASGNFYEITLQRETMDAPYTRIIKQEKALPVDSEDEYILSILKDNKTRKKIIL